MPSDLRLPFDEDDRGSLVLERDRHAREHAVDPTRNIVLEASAGTGKTRVLVTRYVNLLRAGVNPANILAMTFTRKAAAEMRERIVAMLAELATTSRQDAARWRDLRDHLGDIAISTIDAFCFSLLREFPLEADLDPGFEVADETKTPRLADEALDAALRVGRRLAGRDPDVALVMAHLGERRLRAGLAALLDRRLVTAKAMRRFLAARQGPSPEAAFAAALARLRGGAAGATADLVAFLADGPVQHPSYAIVRADLAGLADGGVAAPRAWLERVARYFLTREGHPRVRLAPPFKKADCPDAAAYTRHVQAMAAFAPQVEETLQAFARDLNLAMVRGAARLFKVARGRYRHALEAEAAVDFSDGLARALSLLRRMDEFAQSRYRLEARYHHILVDEFQDTSRAQWRLVARLVESWGEGIGLAQDAPLQPSIFVVGDRKQSIYAFRDADVRMLALARRRVAGLRPGGDARRTISRSFRSHPALLAFTNDLFAGVEKVDRPDAFRYRRGDRFPIVPDSPPAGTGCGTGPLPGRDEAPDALGLVVGDAPGQAAAALAAEVAHLLGTAVVHDRRTGVSRPAAPGDVAILFRSRASHQVYEAALEERGVRTYVYKGLGFFDADEVKDILALLRYLADPSSELRAAAFLRSRLVRLSDGALQRLSPRIAGAISGGDDGLADALGGEDRRVLLQARRSVRAWLALVDRVPPAELLDRVLAECAYAFELRGPRLLQARENLKKVRALTRRVQNAGYCTLGRVADHLERLAGGDESNAVIDAADAVNLMTVHAAKGLEFPFVFLVNLTRGTGGGTDPVLVLDEGTGEAPVVSIGGQLPEAAEEVRARDLEETKRLLYVAVTRARERLYLSAVPKAGKFAPAPGSLAEVMPASLGALVAEAFTAPPGARLAWHGGDGAPHQFRVCRTDAASGAPSPDTGAVGRAGPGDSESGPAPDDDFEPLRDVAGRRRTGVAGYSAGLAGPADGGAAARRADGAPAIRAQLVGTLVHRLFQSAGSGAGTGPVLGERALALLSSEERLEVGVADAVVSEAVALFSALRSRADVGDLFRGGECLYEVPFSMRIPDDRHAGGVVVRGSIDCVVRRPDRSVIVVEIKTGAPHAWHESQLALYVDAARAMFPGDPVQGRILYAGDPGVSRGNECNRGADPGV